MKDLIKQSWKFLVQNAKNLFLAFLIAMFFRSFLYEPYKIPSGSMYPTLLIGDHLFVSKFSYGYSKYSLLSYDIPIMDERVWFSEPVRGDIIVFKHPKKDMIYIKRLIAIPGDVVQMLNGIVYVNDKPLARIKSGVWTNPDTGELYDMYTEYSADNKQYSIVYKQNMSNINILRSTAKYKVPKDNYFFMGDNRDNSADSRFEGLGYVHEKYLIGRAEVIFWAWDILNGKDSYSNFHRIFKGL